jgi:hypothetical protein
MSQYGVTSFSPCVSVSRGSGAMGPILMVVFGILRSALGKLGDKDTGPSFSMLLRICTELGWTGEKDRKKTTTMNQPLVYDAEGQEDVSSLYVLTTPEIPLLCHLASDSWFLCSKAAQIKRADASRRKWFPVPDKTCLDPCMAIRVPRAYTPPVGNNIC